MAPAAERIPDIPDPAIDRIQIHIVGEKKLHSTKRCISAVCPSFLRNETCTHETQSTRDPGHPGPGALQALQCIRRGDLITLYVKKLIYN
jgi:hypothetical protein